jgi:RNA polymerase sigma factor for flagellar operon FliA
MRTEVKTPKSMDAVWKDYKKTKDPSRRTTLRNVLMERFLPIVKYNAERIGAKLPDEVENDDLVSAGIFGLMDAIASYDPGRGVKFETFCAPRIRGAILDELRSLDWVPRLVRRRSAELERVSRELEATLGRSPTESEISRRLNLPQPEFEKLVRDANAVAQVSLSRKYAETDSSREVCEIDVIQDRKGPSPIADLTKKDLKEILTRGLTRAERLILILYYYEEMTMKEIGVTLDLSESRVSQMHSSILRRLKDQLETRRKEFVS